MLGLGVAAPAQRGRGWQGTWYGVKDAEMALKPGKHASKIIQCSAGADLAGNKDDVISALGGVRKHHGCAVLSRARRRGRAALSSADEWAACVWGHGQPRRSGQQR